MCDGRALSKPVEQSSATQDLALILTCMLGIEHFRTCRHLSPSFCSHSVTWPLIPHIRSLRTLNLYGTDHLSVPRHALTALQSLCASTADVFATIAEAAPGLTRLTRLDFSANPDFRSSALAKLTDAAHQAKLLLVLRQLSALVSLRHLSLSGAGSREPQALDGTVAFPLLEDLNLRLYSRDQCWIH